MATRFPIEEFLDTRRILPGAFHPEETHLLYSSDAGGIVNVHQVELATGRSEQLTHSTAHAYQAVAWLPDGTGFLYTADDAGDELNHLFLQRPDGSVEDLTPWPGARSQVLEIARDGRSLVFECNRRNPREPDFLRLDLETLESELLHENREGHHFGGLSHDGELLVLLKSRTDYDTDLTLIERATGRRTRLTPHEGEVRFRPRGFRFDSSALYLVSDLESEYFRLWTLPLGEHAGELPPTLDAECEGGNVQGMTVSRDGSRRVLVLDREGRSWFRIEDAGGSRELPEHPGREPLLSASGRWLAFLREGDRHPSGLELVDLGASEVAPVELVPARNPKIPGESLVEAEHVRFPAPDGLEVPGLLYRPLHPLGEEGSRPGVVFCHGGPGGQFRHLYHPMLQYLAHCGFTLLAVNNRGSSGYSVPFYKADRRVHGSKDLDDCVAAREALVDRAGVDPERVAVAGGSYGGFLTLAALAFRSQVFTCGVDIFGVSNWLRTLEEMPPWWGAARAALYDKIGDPGVDEEYLRSISPLFHAEKIQRPLLVLQGAKDPRVVQAESDEIVAAVRGNGVPCEYLLFEDEGHGFRKKENEVRGNRAIREFLERHLLAS